MSTAPDALRRSLPSSKTASLHALEIEQSSQPDSPSWRWCGASVGAVQPLGVHLFYRSGNRAPHPGTPGDAADTIIRFAC